jgi:hypothetical protein
MVTVKLQGGLGNQLFQWAFAKSLSYKHNVDVYLDKSLYLNQVGITEREFSLNKFPNIKYNINTTTNTNRFIIISDDFRYKEYNFEKTNSYYFDGYWQSEKHFKNIKEIILKELFLDFDLHNIIPIKNNSISLHIRRTDYVSSNGLHPVQSIDYYKKAIDVIGDYDYIYVFSDDINWCKNNLNFPNMVFIEGNDNVTDLCLQSMCKNNIIANSSFSWWGAWLNKNEDKKVIAPSNWFGPNMPYSGDIIPEEWIIM